MNADKIEKYLKLVRDTYSRDGNPVVESVLSAQRTVPDVAMSGFYERVANVAGTAGEKVSGGSWKDYWMRNGVMSGPEVNRWPSRCSVCDCGNPAEHGAHVRDTRGRVYIVPLCAEHNNSNNQSKMLLKAATVMVEAPKEENP